MKKNASQHQAQDNQDKEFPGYETYPASEDIYSRAEKINYADPEDLEDVLGQTSSSDGPGTRRKQSQEYEGDPLINGEPLKGDPLDDTALDEQQNEITNEYDDEPLMDATREDPLTGDDLDVPGADFDDLQEEVGNEDEENNYYSLGGDNHENLEEQDGDQIPL